MWQDDWKKDEWNQDLNNIFLTWIKKKNAIDLAEIFHVILS